MYKKYINNKRKQEQAKKDGSENPCDSQITKGDPISISCYAFVYKLIRAFTKYPYPPFPNNLNNCKEWNFLCHPILHITTVSILPLYNLLQRG